MTKAKKLLIINAAKNYGSTGKIAEQIGSIAMSNGWDVLIAHSARYNNRSSLNSYNIGTYFSEKIHAALSLLLDRHGLFSRYRTKEFIKQIEIYKPDIINIHNVHGYYLNYPILFKYLANLDIPIFWTLHDCWSFTGHCSYFDLVNCNKWETGCHNCGNLSNYPKSLFVDNSASNYKLKREVFLQLKNVTLIPVSYWLDKMVSKSFLSKYNSVVIHNGIDIDLFKPVFCSSLKEKLGLAHKFVLLGVSSNGFKGRKGYYDFIKLRNKLPSDYAIILIGLLDDELSDLPDGIIGLKRTSNIKELAEFYSMSDIFLNLTYSDNYPTTNLESIACGTPVITYHTGGSPESIDSETGIVVETGNIDQLLRAIEIIKSCKNSSSFSQNICREHAIKNFDKNRCFSRYLELFNSAELGITSE